MPVLIFHGLDDWAISAHGLNNTWEWLEKDMTLVTITGASH
jgi:pimeloyl-ACP methyl ester carboxylesterase